ncbi:unnamed protein product [Brachionus calyciflorus]|uniref:Vesicle transport protein USE1 n=1 Tax=Brachionus calyciflorus TaxID=104777 RepID=A0A814EVS8_9BILA|nr:unnamed protein product [Brachionus calyciflorus]
MNQKNLEINFQRLLAKTTELAEKEEVTPDWRLGKYVEYLEDFLKQLNKLTVNKPSVDALKDYAKRVEFLKQVSSIKNKKNDIPSQKLIDSTLKLANPGQIITKKDVRQKQIYHKTFLKQENALRDQLFGKTKSNSLDSENIELQELIRLEQENQEKIAQEMLKSVSSIKENSLLASRIIKTDTELLGKMNSTVEANSDNLKVVNDDLHERVSRSCNCWIWLMILLIMIIFIMMVLFMKLFPKKKYANYAYLNHDSYTIPDNHTYSHFIDNTIMVNNSVIDEKEL